MDVVYFVVLVGVLIFVHELGHFASAKFFGVKVHKFSLGFGPRLVGFRKGETEYVVAAVPLGGYVHLLGESPRDVVRPEEEARAFDHQPLWKRLIIVGAGPAMNLLFPIALFFLVYLGDDKLPPPVIGTIFPNRPADGRLIAGDRVLSIDGVPMETFNDVTRAVEANPGVPLEFQIERQGKRVRETITPVLAEVSRALERTDRVGRIGIMPHHPVAVIGITSPSSPAAAAGLRTFDVVVAAGGNLIDGFLDLEDALAPNHGQLVPMTYLRPVKVERALGGLAEMEIYEPRVAPVTPEPGRGSSGLARAGIEEADLYVSHVNMGSPEHRLGLLPGDRLVALDRRPIRLWSTLEEDLRAQRGEEHELMWRRGDRLMTGSLRLKHERGVDDLGVTYDRFVMGIRNWVPMRGFEPVDNPHPIAYAATRAFESTREMVELTIYSALRLLQGRVSVKAIGGPIAIFDVAGAAAREGTLDFLRLMAFVSINLGLINLLPIPLLDGGHLLFSVIESVLRRRLRPAVRQYASLVGLFVLVLLVVLAFKNDIERKWPQIIELVATD